MIEFKDFRIFSDLKEKEVQKLQENSRKIKYGKGEIIFQEGAPAFGLYLVFEGMIKLVKRSMRAKSQILKIAGPGETIYWEASREAALTLDPSFVPVDHAVVGIVDSVQIDPDPGGNPREGEGS